MTDNFSGPIHALLFGLSADLAGDLAKPLRSMCSVRSAPEGTDVSLSRAHIIFCDPDSHVVRTLRAARPDASIVVVSRHPEVGNWLDSIEAGATDYCAAPFESDHVRWILDSSLRSIQSRQ